MLSLNDQKLQVGACNTEAAVSSAQGDKWKKETERDLTKHLERACAPSSAFAHKDGNQPPPHL